MNITLPKGPEGFRLAPLSCGFFKKEPEWFQAVIFFAGNIPVGRFWTRTESLCVESIPPSPVLPACSWLLLPLRGAGDPLPAGKAGPFPFLMHFCAAIP